MNATAEQPAVKAGRNVEDITEGTGRPQYRHFRCRDCEWQFYSQHYKPECICPMCGDFGRKTN